MTRSPMVPVLALASALALAACGGGGGGGGAPSGDNPPQCPPGQTGTYPDCTPAEAGGNGDADDTDGDDGAGDGTEDGDTGTTTGGPGPSPTPGPTPTRPTPTTTPTTPARGTYEALRDRILAAADPAALAGTLDPETLTDNQYDALFELALVMDPGTPETDRATARRIVAVTDWPALDKALADGAIDLGDENSPLAFLHAAHRAELVVREAVRSAFLAANRRADVPGALVPVPSVLRSEPPPNADDLYYSVWMDPGGTINRWDNRNADAVYSRAEIQTIAPENRTGADGATASFRGAASGFAAHIEVLEDGTTLSTAGAMTADVALTVAFGIDSDDDQFDVAPSLTGTIDNFRLVGRTGDLGWTATIDGDLRDGGAVDPGDIDTGKPPYLVRNVNDLSVAFSTDRVTGTGDDKAPLKTHPPTHAAGSFDLTFTDGRAVGAFNAIPRDRPRTE